MSLPPVHNPGQCQTSIPAQGTPSPTHTEIVSPTSTVAPSDPPGAHTERWKRWLSSPAGLVFLGYMLITLSFYAPLYSNSSDHYATDQLSFDKPNGVAILGSVTGLGEFDTKGQLSATWLVYGCGEYGPIAVGENFTTYGPVNRAVDVYLDDASQPAFSYDPTQFPVSQASEILSLRNLISFDTEHRIETDSKYYNPLNHYSFQTFVFVVERATNKSVPIATFAVGDIGSGDLTTISMEVPTTNQFTYEANDGQNTVEVESRTILAKVEYSARARAFTLSMLVINWILTLCSVAIALIVFSRRGRVKDGIALLPVTVILSTPTIRGLYVRSPPFGIFLDVVGFFPQMLTVLMSTVIVLCVLARPEPTQDGGIPSGKGVITIESHAESPAAA